MVLKKIKKIAKRAQKKYSEMVAVNEEIAPKEHLAKDETIAEKRYIHLYLPDIAKAVIITILILAGAQIIFEIRDIILIFFVSLLFAAALDPTVDKLEEKFKIPRGISVLLIFAILIALIVMFISSFIPILARELIDLGIQAQKLIKNLVEGNIELPAFLQWLDPAIQSAFSNFDTSTLGANLQETLVNLGNQLTSLAGNAFKALIAITNGIANAILVLLLTYFMTVDESLIDKFTLQIFPKKHGKYITEKTNAIKNKIGQWVRGQIMLMIVVGIATYIGLLILGIEYAATLAMFAGITEVIPVVGPIIAWIAAIPIAANKSGLAILWVSVLYFIIQRLENNVFVPVIMKRATGLHPLVVIFAMLVGYRFMGVIGVVIAVPVAASIGIFLSDYISKRNS